MTRYLVDWSGAEEVTGIRYICGYCGADTAPAYGFISLPDKPDRMGIIAICTNCNRPTFVETEKGQIVSITPSKRMGAEIAGLPNDVEKLYEEARSCTASNAYTAAVLTCRKILMHIAVEKGAQPNLSFVDYIDYLAGKGYIPPDGKEWVDYIRTKSNEANHEIIVMIQDDAKDLINFVEMLLRLVYEFKQRLPKKTTP